MVIRVRVSGTVDNTPKGNTTISAPEGAIILDSSSTVVTGLLTVNDLAVDDTLYTNFIKSKLGDIQIAPNNGVTDIVGDIRVSGQKPIGTAPVVTNVLYVTMDGDDTNDGRAQDASRACRTIGAALKSPYYQPGTQIRVSPGHYLENNPLRLKPYTSIMGSDLRTTSVEPMNKTQDLFHVESGCYLAFMQMTNGRSGLLEGQYATGYNRGAYAVSFPPLTGTDRIDLFHSPYVQNCTNQSGPWLKDGTMFLPDYTVQVPAAVGTGTWLANTASITISVSTGTVATGMSINNGQQNPGFFNARTLALANKPFLQEQVTAYISQTFPMFVFNQAKSFRDVGILLENAAYDAAFGGNEKSVESGRSFYNGAVSVIAGQEGECIAGIEYLSSLTQAVITNTPVTDLLSGTGLYSQVINTALTGGAISTSSYQTLFSIVTASIADPATLPAIYKSTGPDAAYASAEILLQANRQFLQEQTINYINNNLSNRAFPYNQIKCARDTGLIIDAVALDMLYPTPGFSQSTFAGIQYYSQNGYTGSIGSEITATVAAITYLRDICVKVVQNVTAAEDAIVGITRYSNTSQYQAPNNNIATSDEVAKIYSEFAIILEILGGNTTGWTDRIISNGLPIKLASITNTVNLLQNNIDYLKNEISAYIQSPTGLNFSGYNDDTCRRDIGYIIDSICFDIRNGGNKQAIQSGLYYYTDVGGASVIPYETDATVAAFTYLSTITSQVIQNIPVITQQSGKYAVKQVFSASSATTTEADVLSQGISTITNMLTAGSPVGYEPSPITLTASTDPLAVTAFENIQANRDFLVAETIAWIENTYNPNAFQYNQALCYRDTGLIIDAVSQDILLGGNSKSIEAGLAYWNQGYNTIAGQESITTQAINYVRDQALQVIANTAVTVQRGTVSTQVINPFFKYGDNYMPQQAVARNFNIITNIIQNGVTAAPPLYQGGGISIATGALADDVRLAPKVTQVIDNMDGTVTLGLSTSTVGFGTNATLYFGDVSVYPKQDFEVDALSYQYTGLTSTWAIRKLDPIGSMGGSLVDGAVISDRSPIQSFVYDAFTQVTQGGRGIHITNNGYAQLVSVFTIFCSVGVQVDNGGIASIVNSNDNFGDICLLAKGYGAREFSGTLFNPHFRAYPFSAGPDGLDQYYPNGFWPNSGQVEVFVPDVSNRPHISLVMEVETPDDYMNEQGLPGFLNASPNTGTLTTGTITLTGIDTTGIAIGNTVYIRDQYGSQTDDNGVMYAATGTVVTDLGYLSITLNQPLTSGGIDSQFGASNNNYFNLYFTGNAYYTVLSSTVATPPYPVGQNILSANTDPDIYQGPVNDQILSHVYTIQYLNSIVDQIIDNQTVTVTDGNTLTQSIQPSVINGGLAQTFIDQEFGVITNIIGAADIASAEAVVPANLVSKKGTIPAGAGSAITLIEANLEFLAAEISAYVQYYYSGVFAGLDQAQTDYLLSKCSRDTKLILQRLIYDLETGGNYNAVYTGLSYWGQEGTHHIVQLGENVTRQDLFPDGATVNFYQRSYISASGYVFEYVGAGTNYGALPQVGQSDPVQGKETVQLDSGKVFFTSTDQNGDFRIGPGLVISQATGVLSGRTFTKSLFANMTPFILAIEGLG